jgi:hypothetical protein
LAVCRFFFNAPKAIGRKFDALDNAANVGARKQSFGNQREAVPVSRNPKISMRPECNFF